MTFGKLSEKEIRRDHNFARRQMMRPTNAVNNPTDTNIPNHVLLLQPVQQTQTGQVASTGAKGETAAGTETGNKRKHWKRVDGLERVACFPEAGAARRTRRDFQVKSKE